VSEQSDSVAAAHHKAHVRGGTAARLRKIGG
jgi:hypothetical protein